MWLTPTLTPSAWSDGADPAPSAAREHRGLLSHRLLPLSATDFVLETSQALLSGAIWTPVTSCVAISEDNFVLASNGDVSAAFFRLRAK